VNVQRAEQDKDGSYWLGTMPHARKEECERNRGGVAIWTI